MTTYILGRIGRGVLTVIVVTLMVFFMARVSGDPTTWLLPDDASEATREAMRESLGLNEPLLVQLWQFVIGLASGDAGQSYQYQRPVVELFMERLPFTLSLGLIALLLSILIGIPLGMLAAAHRGTAVDRGTMGAVVLSDTVPDFVQGILLILFGALVLGIFPPAGAATPLSYVLPSITLALGGIAGLARWSRATVLDELTKDYVDTARAKGIGEFRAVVKHAGRNALIPIVTIVGMQVGTLIGGSFVVETVFAWPGVGTLFTNAARLRDFPVVQFGVIVVSTLVVLTTLLVDISYKLLDPRIRIHGN